MAKKETNKKNIKKENKNKKHFFKDFKAELKKVVWPTPNQLFKNTIAVIIIVIITATIVFVLDFVFDTINNYGINRIKTNIKNSVKIEEKKQNDNTIQKDSTNDNIINDSVETTK